MIFTLSGPVWGSREVVSTPLHYTAGFFSGARRLDVMLATMHSGRAMKRFQTEAEYNGTVDRGRGFAPNGEKLGEYYAKAAEEEKVRGTRRKICSPGLALGQFPDKGQSKALCTQS